MSASEAKTPLRSDPTIPWIVAGIVALVMALYALLFLVMTAVEGESQLARWQLFSLLLIPDEVFANATGGKLVWQGVVERLWTCGIATGILWCAAALGWWPVQWLTGGWKLPRWERCLVATGLGLHFLSLVTLVVGLIGWLQTPALTVVLCFAGVLSPLLAGLKHLRSAQPRAPLTAAVSTPIERTLWIAGLLAAAVFSAMILLGAALPPWDFDVREYHLQVPKEWYQSGRIEFAPHNIYANMPLGAEMLPLAAMSLLGDWFLGAIVGKTLMGSCAILTAAAIYGFVRRLASPPAAIAAALVWLAHPWVMHVSTAGLNEQVYALYLTLAVSVAAREGTWKSWLLAGLLAGAAAACKYPAVVMVVLPLAMWAAVAPSLNLALAGSWRLRLSAVGCFLAAAGLSSGAWYAKNAAMAGNPVYPLLGDLLGGTTRTPEKNAQFERGHSRQPYTAAELGNIAIRVALDSDFQSPSLVLAPLVILGASALILRSRQNGQSHSGTDKDANSAADPPCSAPWGAAWAVAALLAFFIATWWLVTHRIDRFLVPAIPLAAVVAGVGVEYARQRPLGYVVLAFTLLGLLYSLVLVASPIQLTGDNRWLMPLVDLRYDQPRPPHYVSRLKEAHRWLNGRCKPHQAVLCVGDAAVFDLEMPVYYHTCFDDCLLVEWMAGRSPTERKLLLQEKQVAYIYVDWNEIARYQSPGNYGFDPRFSRGLLEELMAQRVVGPPLPDAPSEIYPVLP